MRLVTLVFLFACNGADPADTDTDTDSGSDSDTGTGTDTDTDTDSDTDTGPAASIAVTVGADEQAFAWNGTDNRVLCWQYTNIGDYLFVQLAEGSDGSGKRLDLDVCGLGTSGGTFTPMADYSTFESCGGALEFGARWVDAPFAYVVADGATDCGLTLALVGTWLTGSLTCPDMPAYQGGAGSASVTVDAFACEVEAGQ